MRRENLSADIENVDWVDTEQQPDQPCFTIEFDGPEEELRDRFRKPDNSGYTPDDLDIFYRLQKSDHPSVTGGVFSISDSLTGELLIEINASPDLIEKFVYAVRQYASTVDEDIRFEVRIRVQDQQVAVFDKETLLVYGADGTLLRRRSLIPDGIEI